jgi:hypothetical protein
MGELRKARYRRIAESVILAIAKHAKEIHCKKVDMGELQNAQYIRIAKSEILVNCKKRDTGELQKA